MKIDNKVANELLIAVRKGERMQEFMDAVAGVNNYRLDDHRRQGAIRNYFSKELISDQFLLAMDDIISEFWRGVFEKIDKAELFGSKVLVNKPGEEKVRRSTNNNPIHYLRNYGYFSVRNYINSLYRKNLAQGCSNCGCKTAVKNNKKCPDCGHDMSTVYKFVFEAESVPTMNDHTAIEDKYTSKNIDNLLAEFADKTLGEGTRAYQVLKIITEPDASRPMCNACGLCDAETFDMDMCTNYNANIGKFLGVNKTMIANKMKRIRKAFVEWLYNHNSHEAEYLLSVIPNKHKSLKILE